MNLLDIIRDARRHLQENGRVSLRVLRRQFELDDEALEELIEELVDVQRVARREENVLVWAGDATQSAREPTPEQPAARDLRVYTPKHLADKILQSRSALEGERKQVTVLFADVKGSMELAQQLDPEQWHAILERFFEILAEGVHRFEGTVNQYTGDGIMALFGAPIAHEDHGRAHATLPVRRGACESRVGPHPAPARGCGGAGARRAGAGQCPGVDRRDQRTSVSTRGARMPRALGAAAG